MNFRVLVLKRKKERKKERFTMELIKTCTFAETDDISTRCMYTLQDISQNYEVMINAAEEDTKWTQ
jgi:hypothetical protein